MSNRSHHARSSANRVEYFGDLALAFAKMAPKSLSGPRFSRWLDFGSMGRFFTFRKALSDLD